MADLAAYLEKVSEQACLLIAGTARAYDAGSEIWKLGMDGIGDDYLRPTAWPLWLIWGSLTDLVDGRRGQEPGAEERASEVMRRAASEWLDASGDPLARSRYLDRWVYDECGYDRKDSHGP
jgi:hypothetical protein